MSGSDKSGFEVLTSLVGALVLVFAAEAGSWYVAHQFAWWTFALAMGASVIVWAGVKAGWKEFRTQRRKRRDARILGERLMATGRVPANRRQS